LLEYLEGTRRKELREFFRPALCKEEENNHQHLGKEIYLTGWEVGVKKWMRRRERVWIWLEGASYYAFSRTIANLMDQLGCHHLRHTWWKSAAAI